MRLDRIAGIVLLEWVERYQTGSYSVIEERARVVQGAAVRSETIDKENYSTVDWDDGYFKYCEFDRFSIEGATVSSDFLNCSFKGLDCYWILFSYSNFIACRFTDCTFAGTKFPDTRFVDCSFVNCKFIRDNLDGECDFSKTVAYGCSVENCVGFEVLHV